LVARPCRDGYVAICATNRGRVRTGFLLAIDRPELAADERFIDKPTRNLHRDAFDREMAPFLDGAHTAEEVVAILDCSAWPRPSGGGGGGAGQPPARPPRVLGGRPGTGEPLPAAVPFADAGAPRPGVLRPRAGRRRSPAGVVVLDFSVFLGWPERDPGAGRPRGSGHLGGAPVSRGPTWGRGDAFGPLVGSTSST